MSERFRCAIASATAGESCIATASQVRRWVLVEQPGTWGRDAVLESAMAADTALRLQGAARAAAARLLLIRRHGRSAPARRACFVAVTSADVQRIERVEFDDPAELLELDWAALRRGRPGGGEVVADPLYLVCTNGRHDPCCAEFGRPVAAALAGVLGEHVWESSHFGGDRFAGNLVCLPDGVYYGRVTPDVAEQLVADHARGVLDLDRYRGRSWQPFVAQAAEALVRERLGGLRGLADVVATSVEDGPGARAVVRLAGPQGERLVATVECDAAADEQQLTCHSTSAEHPRRYRLLDLERPG